MRFPLRHPFTSLTLLLCLFIVAAWARSFWVTYWWEWEWRSVAGTTVSARTFRIDLEQGRLLLLLQTESVELPQASDVAKLITPGFDPYHHGSLRVADYPKDITWWRGDLWYSLGFECMAPLQKGFISIGGKPGRPELELGLGHLGMMRLPWSFSSRFLGFPAILPALLLGMGPLWQYWMWRRRHQKQLHGLCPKCAYDLRAHQPGDKCPECGTPVAP